MILVGWVTYILFLESDTTGEAGGLIRLICGVRRFDRLPSLIRQEVPMPARKLNPQPWWKCSECGYTYQAAPPPAECPSCQQKCVFVDVTCYTPECGPGSPDPQLMHTPTSERVKK